MKKLNHIFKTKNTYQLTIVFLVFGISGSLSVYFSGPILEFLKIKELITFYPLYLLFRILVIFPIYQVVLLLVALIFGQFSYFWEFQKKLWLRLNNK